MEKRTYGDERTEIFSINITERLNERLKELALGLGVTFNELLNVCFNKALTTDEITLNDNRKSKREYGSGKNKNVSLRISLKTKNGLKELAGKQGCSRDCLINEILSKSVF